MISLHSMRWKTISGGAGRTTGGSTAGSTGGSTGGGLIAGTPLGSSTGTATTSASGDPLAEEDPLAAAPANTVRMYGTATELRVDVSRLPRIDQYEAISDPDSQLGVTDIPLLIQDKRLAQDGSLEYKPRAQDHFLGYCGNRQPQGRRLQRQAPR